MADKLLRLNLQHFAEEDDPKDGPKDEPKDDETGDNPEDKQDDPKDENPKDKPKTVNMTQEEFDKVIEDRLARAKKKKDDEIQKERDEAERTRLEENEQYKELADKRQEEVDQLKKEQEEQKADVLNAKKESLLVKAGYSDDQVKRYTKYLDGESNDELATSLEALKSDIPPTPSYADPSAGNGEKQKPGKTGLREEGKTAYQRLKEKGKIKGKKK